MAHEIVLVDDEPQVLTLQQAALKGADLSAECFTDPFVAWEHIQREKVSLVITDWNMPGMNGMDLLFKIRGMELPPHVIILTAYGTVGAAVQAMNQGAFHFLEKPFRIEQYVQLVQDALAQFHGAAPATPRSAAESGLIEAVTRGPVVCAPVMQKIFEMARAAAATNAAVLLLGESGTGKEVLADYIHAHSPRVRGPMIKVNCGALPENLMESELFGHEKGAFTGALKRRVGRFEQADGGTLFLDEVGDLLLPLQVKLLRALQDCTIEPVGANAPVRVDFRLISATNQDLRAGVTKGTFREDLYYRVNVVPISLPPLRERQEEIEPLVQHFMGHLQKATVHGPKGFSPEALARLKAFHWPGNVRQLRNAIEYSLVLCRGDLVEVADLPQEIRGAPETPQVQAAQPEDASTRMGGSQPRPTESSGLRDSLSEATARTIISALERHHWRISAAARELQISRSSLYERINKLGIKKPEP